MDNALHMTERVCGAQDIQRSLETFDAKVKGNPNYKVFQFTCTVESHDYVLPPLCMLALGIRGKGACMQDPNISV